MKFDLWLKDKVTLVEKSLGEYDKLQDNMQKTIYEAMNYSIFAGGKRLRPVIMLGVYEMFDDKYEQVLPFACSMEMIHTYSLIHDDLPAMDNDDYRRGKLSNHKKFGEATAILAGDALLNRAFETMSTYSLTSGIEPQRALKAISIIARSSGTEGMIGGQVVDTCSDTDIKNLSELEYMHRLKTGAIIKSSAVVGATLGGASEEQLKQIEVFASKLGLAFQIQDDILDVEGSAEKLGKPIGSDKDNGKVTFVTMIGLEESRQYQKRLTEDAIKALKTFGDKANMLIELCNYLLNRQN